MYIKKFDFDYGRRVFVEKLSKGVMTAGVLCPLWPLVVRSTDDISKAYPDELVSIEAYTKGKIKVGDYITADNVEYVKDLIEPVLYRHITDMGRRIRIVETTHDLTRMYPYEYLQASLRNNGKARFDSDGNVVTLDGKPWIGGNPFMEPQTAEEVMANLTLSWGRHDQSMYAVRDWDLNPEGDVDYQYDFVWVEQNTIGLLNNPDGPYLAGDEDKLRYQSVWFTHPNDSKGTSFLNIWYYDQRKFPDLYGYLPAFKRVRRFPTNQRFEPLVPGMSLYLSDAWAAGDPMLTWGNYKIVGRQPMLGAVSQNWNGDRPNWEPAVHGGPKDQTFFDINFELCPECIIIEAEPTGYPRSPVSKKKIWLDTRNLQYVAYNTYDRRGELWKSFEPIYGYYEKGDLRAMDGKHPAWSWTAVHSHDIQTNRMTRFYQAEGVRGGYKSQWNMGDVYDKYLTVAAMRRLGS